MRSPSPGKALWTRVFLAERCAVGPLVAEGPGSLIAVGESQVDDGSNLTIGFKDTAFVSAKNFHGVYHGWEACMILHSLYLVRGCMADRSEWADMVLRKHESGEAPTLHREWRKMTRFKGHADPI